MHLSTTMRPAPSRGTLKRSELTILLTVCGVAATLWWLCHAQPASLPAWAPWEFSWSQFLASALALSWYARGVALSPPAERPALWRQGSFVLGLLAIYAVLLTHFEYAAQHMFFLNRLQHGVMHHFGPFLIALAWPGRILLRGMPRPLARLFTHPALGRAMRVIQQPLLAGVLFTGLIYLWLIPAVHFRAMINPWLYDVMNWSMVLDGLFFWCLVLDPRPSPPARSSFAARLAITTAVMFPQIAMGASITFSTHALYSYYDLCGRLFPAIGALHDQHIGGIIVWIPSAMMSSLAFLLILNHMRIHEDSMFAEEKDDEPPRGTVFSSGWTGR